MVRRSAVRSLLSFTSKQSTGRCGRRRPQTVVVTMKQGKDKADLAAERAEAANRGSSGRNNTASVFFSERNAGWPRRWHAVFSLENLRPLAPVYARPHARAHWDFSQAGRMCCVRFLSARGMTLRICMSGKLYICTGRDPDPPPRAGRAIVVLTFWEKFDLMGNVLSEITYSDISSQTLILARLTFPSHSTLRHEEI